MDPLDLETDPVKASDARPVEDPLLSPLNEATPEARLSPTHFDNSQIVSVEVEATKLSNQSMEATELAPPLTLFTQRSASTSVGVDSTQSNSIPDASEDLESLDLDSYPSSGAPDYFSSHVVSAPEHQPPPAKHGIRLRIPLSDIPASSERSSEPGTSSTHPLVPPGLFPP